MVYIIKDRMDKEKMRGRMGTPHQGVRGHNENI